MQYETQGTATTGGGNGVRREGISWRRLPSVTLLAALGTALVNAIIYFAASGLGFVSRSALVPTPGGEQPLTLAPVVVSSMVGAVGAAGVFAVIGMFARRPVRLFRVVATVVLVLSLAMPLSVTGAPLAMILTMEAMHVAAWAVIVGLLTTLARREEIS